MTLLDERAGVQDPRIFTPRDLALVRAGWAALCAIAIAAVVVALLAFQPWVDYGARDAAGTDIKVLTGANDGYFVAGLAAIIIACALGVLGKPRWTLGLIPVVAVSAMAIFITACYSIGADWGAAGADETGAFVVGGDITVVPYLIATLSVAIGVLAAVLAAFRASMTR